MAKRRNRKKRPSGTGQPKTKAALPIGAQRTQIPKLAAGSSQLPRVTQSAVARPQASSTVAASAVTNKVTSKAQSAVMLPKAAQTVGFTELEEAFFAAGDSMAERIAAKIARLREEEDDAPPPRPSFWRRLFARSPAATT